MGNATSDEGKRTPPGALFVEGEFWAVADTREAVEAATRAVVERVRSDIAWYGRKSYWPKRISWTIRVTAVVLGVAGGLCPLLPVADADRAWVVPLGYVFFALAAGTVVLDQVFGFSATWMRFTTAQLRLRRAFDRFQIELLEARAAAPFGAPADPIVVAALLKTFLAAVDEIVLGETETWVTEFRASLLRIEDHARGRRPEAPAAAVESEGVGPAAGAVDR